MEMTTRVHLAAIYRVETVCPVDAEQTYHRQEDSYSCTHRPLHVEGIELLHRLPCVSSLGKDQTVNVCTGSEHEGIAQLYREPVVGISATVARCKRAIVVTAHSYCLGGIRRTVTTGTVTSHVVGLEGRPLVAVVATQYSKFHTGHEDKALVASRQCGVGAALELPLVILYPAVFLLLLLSIGWRVAVGCQVLVVLVVEGTPRWSQVD